MSNSQNGNNRSSRWDYWIGGLVAAMFITDFVRPRTAREKREERASNERAEAAIAQKARVNAQARAREEFEYQFWLPGAEGRKRLDAQTITTIPIENPYPDIVKGSGQFPSETRLSSAQAGLGLDVSWTAQESRLTIRKNGTLLFEFEDDAAYPDRKSIVESDDLPLLRKIARLLVGYIPGSLQVRRTDWRLFQDRIWNEYLQSHPELVTKFGLTGPPPYPVESRGLRNFAPRRPS